MKKYNRFSILGYGAIFWGMLLLFSECSFLHILYKDDSQDFWSGLSWEYFLNFGCFVSAFSHLTTSLVDPLLQYRYLLQYSILTSLAISIALTVAGILILRKNESGYVLICFLLPISWLLATSNYVNGYDEIKLAEIFSYLAITVLYCTAFYGTVSEIKSGVKKKK